MKKIITTAHVYRGRGKKQLVYKNVEKIMEKEVEGTIVCADIIKVSDMESFHPDANIELNVVVEDVEDDE